MHGHNVAKNGEKLPPKFIPARPKTNPKRGEVLVFVSSGGHIDILGAVRTPYTRFRHAALLFPLTDSKQVLNNHTGIDLPGNTAAREDALALARDLEHGVIMPGCTATLKGATNLQDAALALAVKSGHSESLGGV